jgi:hypothetical protein
MVVMTEAARFNTGTCRLFLVGSAATPVILLVIWCSLRNESVTATVSGCPFSADHCCMKLCAYGYGWPRVNSQAGAEIALVDVAVKCLMIWRNLETGKGPAQEW